MKCPLYTSLDPRDIYFTFFTALESTMDVNNERIRTISLDSVDGIMVYTLPRMVVLGCTPDSPRVLGS